MTVFTQRVNPQLNRVQKILQEISLSNATSLEGTGVVMGVLDSVLLRHKN